MACAESGTEKACSLWNEKEYSKNNKNHAVGRGVQALHQGSGRNRKDRGGAQEVRGQHRAAPIPPVHPQSGGKRCRQVHGSLERERESELGRRACLLEQQPGEREVRDHTADPRQRLSSSEREKRRTELAPPHGSHTDVARFDTNHPITMSTSTTSTTTVPQSGVVHTTPMKIRANATSDTHAPTRRVPPPGTLRR
jgi:hypothetical protein